MESTPSVKSSGGTLTCQRGTSLKVEFEPTAFGAELTVSFDSSGGGGYLNPLPRISLIAGSTYQPTPPIQVDVGQQRDGLASASIRVPSGYMIQALEARHLEFSYDGWTPHSFRLIGCTAARVNLGPVTVTLPWQADSDLHSWLEGRHEWPPDALSHLKTELLLDTAVNARVSGDFATTGTVAVESGRVSNVALEAVRLRLARGVELNDAEGSVHLTEAHACTIRSARTTGRGLRLCSAHEAYPSQPETKLPKGAYSESEFRGIYVDLRLRDLDTIRGLSDAGSVDPFPADIEALLEKDARAGVAEELAKVARQKSTSGLTNAWAGELVSRTRHRFSRESGRSEQVLFGLSALFGHGYSIRRPIELWVLAVATTLTARVILAITDQTGLADGPSGIWSVISSVDGWEQILRMMLAVLLLPATLVGVSDEPAPSLRFDGEFLLLARTAMVIPLLVLIPAVKHRYQSRSL